MSQNQKNIILMPANYDGISEEKAILKINAQRGITSLELKCYNIRDVKGKVILGILAENNDLTKFDVQSLSQNQEFKINKELNLDKKISCVVVEMIEDSSQPIVWGSTATNVVWQDAITAEFKKEENKEQKDLKDSIYESDEEIETLIDEELEKNIKPDEEIISEIKSAVNDCKNCTYRKKFYNATPSNVYELKKSSTLEELKNEKQPQKPQPEQLKEEKSLFYKLVEEQVQDLFKKHKQDKAMEEIIPDSKFVKVEYGEMGEYYVFGLIYENKDPKYICYGLPGEYEVRPQEQLDGFCQWLPLDIKKPKEEGYWVMYQDAVNGDAIRVEMV